MENLISNIHKGWGRDPPLQYSNKTFREIYFPPVFQSQYIWYFDGVQNKLTLLPQLLVAWTTLALIELCLWIRLKYFVTGLYKTKYLSKDKVRQTYVNISPMWDMRLS